MRLKTPQYYVIYSDILRQILSGKLRKGERLLSNSAYCSQYGVSNITVRRAISLLRENHLIVTSPRRVPAVQYDIDSLEVKERLRHILAAKKVQILNTIKAHSILLPAMLQSGLQQYTKKELSGIRVWVEALDVHVSASIHYWDQLTGLVHDILSKTRNRTATELFDTFLSTLFYSIQMSGSGCNHFRLVREGFKESLLDALNEKAEMAVVIRRQMNALIAETAEYLENLPVVSPDEEPYTYRFLFPYFSGDALPVQVGLDFMQKIYSGEYADGEMLPTQAEIERRYGLTADTTFRAMQILNGLGFAKSLTSVGNMVTFNKDTRTRIPPAQWDERIHDRLQGYFDAMHILSICCGDIVGAAIPQLIDEELSVLKNDVQRHQGFPKLRAYLPLHILRYMVSRIGNPCLTDLYELLHRRMLFGNYLDQTDRSQRLYELGEVSVACLELGQPESFASRLSEAFLYMRQVSREACERLGGINLYP